MSYPLNDRLLTAAELGDALTITKLLKRSILLDVNVRDQPFGETALAKAVRGINPLLHELFCNFSWNHMLPFGHSMQ